MWGLNWSYLVRGALYAMCWCQLVMSVEEISTESDAEMLIADNSDTPLSPPVVLRRDRQHITATLQLDSDLTIKSSHGSQETLNELETIYESAIAPIESLYNYGALGINRVTATEIHSKPMVLVIGPWSTGKSSIINYLLDIEDSPYGLYTGAEPTTSDFTVVMHGGEFRTIDGVVLATDKTQEFSALEKYGQAFLERLRGQVMPSELLRRVTIVDTPGIIENRRQQERGYPFNDVMKWFIDRAALIFTTFDPSKLDVGLELESTFKQLKGRESQIRIILNKADSLEFTSLMRVYGALFWNLAPLINVTEPPRVYIGSFRSVPFRGPPTYHDLFHREEVLLLQDLFDVAANSVQNKVALVRQHAVRVLVHAEIVSAYVEAFRRNSGIFTDNNNLWNTIVSDPDSYDIYRSVLASSSVISRYDLPASDRYRSFFQTSRLDDFRPLSAHCKLFAGCPRDRLLEAVAATLPRLLTRYRTNAEQTCDSHDVDGCKP